MSDDIVPIEKWVDVIANAEDGRKIATALRLIQNTCFRAGAADMRERAARFVYDRMKLRDISLAEYYEDQIRALPLTAPSAGVPPCSHPERSQYRDGDGEWHCENCEPVDDTGRKERG